MVMAQEAFSSFRIAFKCFLVLNFLKAEDKSLYYDRTIVTLAIKTKQNNIVLNLTLENRQKHSMIE